MMFTLLILRAKHNIINGKEPLSILLHPFLFLCVFSTSNEENKDPSLHSHNMEASWHCWPLCFTPHGLCLRGEYWWQEEESRVCCKLIIPRRCFITCLIPFLAGYSSCLFEKDEPSLIDLNNPLILKLAEDTKQYRRRDISLTQRLWKGELLSSSRGKHWFVTRRARMVLRECGKAEFC